MRLIMHIRSWLESWWLVHLSFITCFLSSMQSVKNGHSPMNKDTVQVAHG